MIDITWTLWHSSFRFQLIELENITIWLWEDGNMDFRWKDGRGHISVYSETV